MSTHSQQHGEKFFDEKDVEVVSINVVDSGADIIDFEEKKDLKRGLGQRHIQMIALAGTIGTGLFLGSGRAITNGGPVGALMGYTFVGILVSCVVISQVELAALVPLSGSIVRHAEYFFDPALSFAQGWNSVYSNCVSLPAEITAGAVLIQYWTTISNGLWITILGLLLVVSNLMFVRVYGELEFGFAMLKIMLIVGLIIMGLVIDLGGGPGHHRYAFQYWRNPGPFVQYLGIDGSLGGFLGFWTTFSNAAYAYGGVEGVANTAAETQNPRRNIPLAAKRIFWRVLIFYVIAIFVVTLIVPSNDANLLRSSGNASQSPFVIAATNAGIAVVPHIINAVVLTSAWSAGNSGLLNGSRNLYGMARENHTPKIFLRVNRFGVPYVAVLFLSAFLCLAYMTLSDNASTVFSWFQDLCSSAILVHWTIICAVYLRFYYGMKKQHISRTELPWKAPFQPYAAWIGLISFLIILLTGGYAVFIHGHWDTETFFSAYFNIPLIFTLFFGYKFLAKTKMVRLDEMPIQKYIDIAKENPEPPAKPVKGWKRVNILWS
ncbi:amino acid permease/ SLC12A domain-containing protein [Desarmillaria tabescens]|uniref:Amino acid permease/ SLC12A domain-containing protein n=1 Tax=Armillaria tabescens TaxID=1929756 RepID=A0AA39TPX9_ARMTA|nr:amino acid permease/ SLC12A domain-containing protein [Desarmillaria tabescens]KAK0462373.1 amino acid permease/ SLC12A domain-containing protein [Desarmillaria tabescens]